MYLLGQGKSPNYGTALVQRVQGLGCACGGSCNGNCGTAGLGLFDSGFDVQTWGPLEWVVIGLGAFALFSMASTSRRGIGAVRGGLRARQSKARKKKSLQQRRADLDKELNAL